jgi:hypothetical protein
MRWTHWIPVLVGALITLTSFPALGQSNYPTSTSVTGTVVSTSGDEVVLRTPSGEQTFMLSSTVDRTQLTTGNSVTVWYDAPVTAGDRGTITRITMASEPTTPRTETGAATSTTTSDELPATAGFLPLLGLIGLLALGGGLLMRKGSRSSVR